MKRIAWEDFYKNIDLVRYRGKETVKYVGTIVIDKITYTAEFEYSRDNFNENLDKLSFIDGFAKEQIANDIAKQINIKAAKHVTNI